MTKLTVGFCFVILVSCGSEHPSYTSSTRDLLFPSRPHNEVTPGSLCKKATTKRHPEKINYCKRDVPKSRKNEVIAEYDRDFGYSVQKQNRSDFKVDHYIPLCIGGSNEKDNLWPQHKKYYNKTDIIEQRLCDLIMVGNITQNEAVTIIKEIKFDPTDAAKLRAQLEARL